MLRVSVLLLCLGGLALACGDTDTEPTIAFQYVVRGSGNNVEVTYLQEMQGLVRRTVTLPWTSEEFQGTKESFVRIEADGPPGSRVRCAVRFRPIDGVYGGNGSGESAQYANRPDEDQTVCALDQSIQP